jgi:hypothetical protein
VSKEKNEKIFSKYNFIDDDPIDNLISKKVLEKKETQFI